MEKIRNPETGQESTVEDHLRKLEKSKQSIEQLFKAIEEGK